MLGHVPTCALLGFEYTVYKHTHMSSTPTKDHLPAEILPHADTVYTYAHVAAEAWHAKPHQARSVPLLLNRPRSPLPRAPATPSDTSPLQP